jgi:hypothetical protein
LVLTTVFITFGRYGIWPFNLPHWSQLSPELDELFLMGMTRNMITIWAMAILQGVLMQTVLRGGHERARLTQQYFASVWCAMQNSKPLKRIVLTGVMR